MIESTGFEAYAMWNALKLHFTSDYDYFKYYGKTSVSKETFARNKQKYYFYRLARRYTLEEFRDVLVANALENHINFAGYLTTNESDDNYKKWQKRVHSLTYHFENDIIYLLEQGDMLKVVDGEHPLLLTKTMQKVVNLETLCILNDILNFLPMWKEKISDEYVWPTYCKLIEKYTPFIRYDKVKFKKILKEKIKENAET